MRNYDANQVINPPFFLMVPQFQFTIHSVHYPSLLALDNIVQMVNHLQKSLNNKFFAIYKELPHFMAGMASQKFGF